MFFLILFLIGICLTIITRILINVFANELFVEEIRSLPLKILIYVLAIACIALVGGIAVANFLGTFVSSNDILLYILIAIIPSFLTYTVGTGILGLYHFEKIASHICFILVFIISIICFTIPIVEYERNIQRLEEEIEKVEETVIESNETRDLLYFCNVPVQNVSGSIKGSFIIGNGTVSGKVKTSSELPYWYIDENNEGKYDSAIAADSKIIFIDEGEKPHIEIILYCTYTKKIDHNNGTEEIDSSSKKRWKQNVFYLPKEVMQYSLE